MSTASRFLDSLFRANNYAKKDLTTHFLTPTEAVSLEAALKNDASRYFYSTLVTFVSGVDSIKSNHYSWAAVKLYYSIFYTLRSWLAVNGRCLFYFEQSPFLLVSNALESPNRKNGPSHKILLTEFQNVFPSNYFSTGQIGLVSAFEWIKSKREEVNYRTERFNDPAIPYYFSGLRKQSVRRLLEEYVNNKSYQWEFDPDHALLAMPLKLIMELKAKLVLAGIETEFSNDELTFLKNSASDSNGPISVFLRSSGIMGQ